MSQQSSKSGRSLKAAVVFCFSGLATSLLLSLLLAQEIWQKRWAKSDATHLVWSAEGHEWSGGEWCGIGYRRMHGMDAPQGYVDMALRTGSEENRQPKGRIPGDPDAISVYSNFESGWPAPLLQYGHVMLKPTTDGGSPTQYYWGAIFPKIRGHTITLPYNLWWPGLLIDTALFGAGLWGISWVGGRTRRSWRLSRNRCPRCAYDMRSIGEPTCPECGWSDSRPRAAPTPRQQ